MRLLTASRELAAAHGWQLQQLESASAEAEGWLRALLEEAITSREQGWAPFSLALMDLVLAHGLRSPWLQDNRARALVDLERFEAAAQAWRLMAEQADSDHARRTATEMLSWLRPQAERQRQRRQAEDHGERAAQLLAAGDVEASVATLVEGLLVCPDHGGLTQTLSSLLEQRRRVDDRKWQGLPAWIQRHELALELSSLRLEGLRRRCADPAVSSAAAAPAADAADAVPAGTQPAGWR